MNNISHSKIFCIGWHKTGTSTLGDALIELGYNVSGARLDLAESLLKSNIKPSLEIAKSHEALQDVPWAIIYKELDIAFPNSKFILTIRDEQEWINSAQKHFKDTYSEMREWIYGVGVLEGNEEVYLKRYRRHYAEVREYFKDRPEDILVMDFKNGDGWEKLCGFLDKPIPKKPFPHSNKGKHNYTFKDKVVNTLRGLTPEWLRDFRLDVLVKLGFPDRRDRFNNKKYNKPMLDKNKKS